MEKLKGDMLEMILSSEKGRLAERNTMFLIAQVFFFPMISILIFLTMNFFLDLECLTLFARNEYCPLRFEAGKYFDGIGFGFSSGQIVRFRVC